MGGQTLIIKLTSAQLRFAMLQMGLWLSLAITLSKITLCSKVDLCNVFFHPENAFIESTRVQCPSMVCTITEIVFKDILERKLPSMGCTSLLLDEGGPI